jgi:hypothetical protein
LLFAFALLLAIAPGCGSGSGTSLPVLAIVAMTPADGATGINLSTTVAATFNQQMNQSTINDSTFSLSDPTGALVPGEIAYNATTFTATLSPAAPLVPDTTYTAAVSGGVANVANTTLGNDVTWSFSTGSLLNRPFHTASISLIPPTGEERLRKAAIRGFWGLRRTPNQALVGVAENPFTAVSRSFAWDQTCGSGPRISIGGSRTGRYPRLRAGRAGPAGEGAKNDAVTASAFPESDLRS